MAAEKQRKTQQAATDRLQEFKRRTAQEEYEKKYGTPEENIRKAREEGARALEQWDAVIRDNTAHTRKSLEKVAVTHSMSNWHGVRIDTYVLKDGRAVICSTTIRGNSAAIMNCDGEP